MSKHPGCPVRPLPNLPSVFSPTQSRSRPPKPRSIVLVYPGPKSDPQVLGPPRITSISGSGDAAPPSPSFSRQSSYSLSPAEGSAREGRGIRARSPLPTSAASARPLIQGSRRRRRRAPPPRFPASSGSSPQSSAHEPERNRCRATGASCRAGQGSGDQKSNKPVDRG